jgi:hypothetical protein
MLSVAICWKSNALRRAILMAEIFKIPSNAELEECCSIYEIKLSTHQYRRLRELIQSVHAALKETLCAEMSPDDRKDVMKHLKIVQSSLADLLSALHITPEAMAGFDDDVPVGLGTPAGWVAMSRLTGAVTGRRHRRNDLAASALPFEAPELCHDLVKVKTRIDEFLKGFVKDTGGRNPDIIRNGLALSLAHSFESILGAPMKTTIFTKLVCAVFDACGLPQDGREKLVERLVKSLKAKA